MQGAGNPSKGDYNTKNKNKKILQYLKKKYGEVMKMKMNSEVSPNIIFFIKHKEEENIKKALLA